MATTTNYSWTTPDDTALVKDGAAAIRSLGTAIDTTVFNNAGAAIAKTIVDAKGDIIAATAADTVSRLAVGTNGQILEADSTTATGLKWATPASAGSLTSIASGSLTGASVVLGSIPTTYKSLKLILDNYYGVSNGALTITITGITTGYFSYCVYRETGASGVDTGSAAYLSYFKNNVAGSANNNYAEIDFPNYASTTSQKMFTGFNTGTTTAPAIVSANLTGSNSSTAAITSLTLAMNSGNWGGGTYILYGVN